MNTLWQLLGSGAGTTITDVTGQVHDYVRWITLAFLTLAGIFVLFFAIYVGWRMAKAEDDGKRKDAKMQLIYSLVGLVSIIVIIVVLQVILPLLHGTVQDHTGQAGVDIPGWTETLTAIQDVVTAIINILVTLAILFAIYIGWQLMKAEDDSKRKQAKMQLIYTFAGIIAVVVITVIANAIIDGVITQGLG